MPIEELSEQINQKHWLWSRVTAGTARERAAEDAGGKAPISKSVV